MPGPHLLRTLCPAIGTVVVLGQFTGTLAFGQDCFSSTTPQGVLLALEANGQPRWLRRFEPWRDQNLAVDPAGKVAVIGGTVGADAPSDSPHGLSVLVFNLAGNALWQRTITGSGADYQIFLNSAAFAQHDLVLAGWFQGTLDVGTGAHHAAADSSQGFLLDLAP